MGDHALPRLRTRWTGTYGIATSLSFKTYPAINITTSFLAFGVGDGTREHIVFIPPPTPLPRVSSSDAFWRGVQTYYRFGRRVVDRGGIGFSFVYPRGPDSFTFVTETRIPVLSPAEVRAFLQPPYDELRGQGIEVVNPEPETVPYGAHYPRLLALNRVFWDPAHVFRTPTTPGSEDWEVRPVDDFPHSQNGRLCRGRNAEGRGY